ncbi:MAG: T9SS type A sorting domain-containing protein [Bacteroidota bacterium]
MNRPLSLFIKLCLLVSFFVSHLQSKADHIAGCDFSYKCTTTPGVYEISLLVMRECTGVPMCSTFTNCTQTINLFGVDSPFQHSTFGTVTLTLQSVRDVNANPDCPGAKSICTNMGTVTPGTYTPAIERYEFKGFVNLGPTSGIPAACCNIRMAWTICCRAGTINTGSNVQNFYTEATINRCLSVSPCNSSPEFSNDAFEAFCASVPYMFTNAVTDPDYDSLSFEFAPGLQGLNNTVTYLPPFTYTKPMPFTGNATDAFPNGIRCDPNTGDISFTTNNIGGQNFYGIVSIAIKQWKMIHATPTLLGTTRREIMLVALANCIPNSPPRIVTSHSKTLQSNWEVCSGQPLCFNITALDTDFILPLVSDTTRLTWNGMLTKYGATFLPTYNVVQRKLHGPREDMYQFCWTPHDSLARTIPYYFTVQAKDSRCPHPGTATRSFSVKVNQGYTLTDTVNLIKTDSGCGRYYFHAVHQHPSASTFERQINISLHPNDPAFTYGKTSYAYKPNMMHIFNDTGMYYIQYKVYDTAHAIGKCAPFLLLKDSIYITQTHHIPDLVSVTHPTCFGLSNGIIHATPSGKNYSYALNHFSFSSDSVFYNLAPGSYTVYIKDNTTGCIKELKDVNIPIPERTIMHGVIHGGNPSEYVNDSAQYQVLVNQPSTPVFNWMVSGGTILTGQGTPTITVKWTIKGIGSVRAIVSDKGCSDTADVSIHILNVGLQDIQSLMGLSIAPNPTKNMLNISVQTLPVHAYIYLYDLQGKLILHQELKHSQQLHLDELPQGIYMLRVGDWYGKVVKD